jgi:hypothetical protein
MGNMNNILNKIIEADGSCTQWACPSICKNCPLSKLRQKPNGTYLSCIEALGVQDMTEEQADAKYKEVATRLLLDEAIDEILGESNVSE